MRLVLVLLAAAGCGRIGFDAVVPSDDASSPSDAIAVNLACGESATATATPIMGSAFEAVATTNRLAVVWIDPAGALFATTWKASPGGVEVVKDKISIDAGPYTQLWATTNGDEIAVAARGATETTGFFLHEELFKTRPIMSLSGASFPGRNPITRRRGGPGFVAITLGGDEPAVYEVPASGMPIATLLTPLRNHAVPSIAADSDGYAVVTELADQFGPGCWYTKLSDTFTVAAGPGSLESTQQADCDTSTVSASAGPAGAAMAWMDRDPVNSYVEFRGTARGSGTASMSGEVDVTLPIIAATSTGFAVLYRNSAGVRAYDAAGARTLAPSSSLADLVSWGDSALAVWTTTTGIPRITRLCPPPAAP